MRKQLLKFSAPVYFCLICLLCSKYFVQDCMHEKNWFLTHSVSVKLQSFDSLYTLKAFLEHLMQINLVRQSRKSSEFNKFL